jgi:RNA-binding protein
LAPIFPTTLELFAVPLGLLWRFDIVADNTGMPLIQLTPAQRKEHRAEAHHLDPVVMIGNDGLTDAVQKEADMALNAHGLIKIRVLSGERPDREQMFQSLANALNAAPIQHIGKLLVLWRPKPAKEKSVDEDRMPGPRDIKVLKYSKRGGQRPEVKTLRVLGNQRLTAGGEVKRAKPKQVSLKKRSQT